MRCTRGTQRRLAVVRNGTVTGQTVGAVGHRERDAKKKKREAHPSRILVLALASVFTYHSSTPPFPLNMSAPPPSEHVTDLKSGPFSVLFQAVKNNTQVLVNVRNNHKLLARVKAYDRHMNL